MLLKVDEVADVLGIAKATAYTVVRELNRELKEQGYYTISGRIEESYLYERFRIQRVEVDDTGAVEDEYNRDNI